MRDWPLLKQQHYCGVCDKVRGLQRNMLCSAFSASLMLFSARKLETRWSIFVISGVILNFSFLKGRKWVTLSLWSIKVMNFGAVSLLWPICTSRKTSFSEQQVHTRGQNFNWLIESTLWDTDPKVCLNKVYRVRATCAFSSRSVLVAIQRHKPLVWFVVKEH